MERNHINFGFCNMSGKLFVLANQKGYDEDETELRAGLCLSDDFMYWAGYLFKVWSLTYPEETAAEILAQSPPAALRQMFGGLHVMSYEQAILELKDLYHIRTGSAALPGKPSYTS